MRQDLVDATLRKKNLSGESLEGREESSHSNTLIPTFQSIEQHDVLAQVLLEIDKEGVELPVEYQVVGEYREVDLLGEELQYSLVQPNNASDFYSLQPPGSCGSSEGSAAEFYSGASPSSQPGSFVELYSDACSPSNSPDSSFRSSQAAVDIESLVDQCFLEEVIHSAV